MILRRLALAEGAANASGLAILIDVFRAFTVVPLLLHRGASRVLLRDGESHTDGANRVLLNDRPGPIAATGDGSLPDSPWILSRWDRAAVAGRTVALIAPVAARAVRTALATADEVLIASFVNAGATAARARALAPAEISLVAIGDEGLRRAPEDEFCADYLTHLLTGSPYDHALAVAGAIGHPFGQRFFQGDAALPPEDPALCLQRDLVEIAVRAQSGEDGLALVPVVPVAAGGSDTAQANAERRTG